MQTEPPLYLQTSRSPPQALPAVGLENIGQPEEEPLHNEPNETSPERCATAAHATIATTTNTYTGQFRFDGVAVLVSATTPREEGSAIERCYFATALRKTLFDVSPIRERHSGCVKRAHNRLLLL